MGENARPALEVRFNRRVRLEFHGATNTSDAGLLAVRGLDEALGLTEMATGHLTESRTGRNVQRPLVPLLRQAVYSRLAGYEDANDAERLALDGGQAVGTPEGGGIMPLYGFCPGWGSIQMGNPS